MKRKLLCLSLTSLFLLGCSKKIEETTISDIKTKIENKEDFIFAITSRTCSHCKNLKKNYKKSSYNYVLYEVIFDDIYYGLQDNKLDVINDYKYLATLVEYAFSNITSYALNSTHEEYFGKDYSTTYGSGYYIEGYVDIVYPLSFFYIDGELVNFELGDYTQKLDAVMSKYNEEVNKNA